MKKDQPKERTSLQTKIPSLPPWPISQPGPMVTEPPPGQRRLPLRSDQVVEIGYDEKLGKSTVRREQE